MTNGRRWLVLLSLLLWIPLKIVKENQMVLSQLCCNCYQFYTEISIETDELNHEVDLTLSDFLQQSLAASRKHDNFECKANAKT